MGCMIYGLGTMAGVSTDAAHCDPSALETAVRAAMGERSRVVGRSMHISKRR